jgi:hypothetical protein
MRGIKDSLPHARPRIAVRGLFLSHASRPKRGRRRTAMMPASSPRTSPFSTTSQDSPRRPWSRDSSRAWRNAAALEAIGFLTLSHSQPARVKDGQNLGRYLTVERAE